MTTWKPNTCDCSFTIDFSQNENGVIVGCSKGTQHGHNLMTDAEAYADAIAICVAAQPPPEEPVE